MATPKYDRTTKTWSIRASYFTNDKLTQKYKGGFRTKIDALEWEEVVSNKDNENPPGSLFAVIDNFLIEKENIDKVAPATLEFYRNFLEIVKKYFGDINVNDITVDKAQLLLNNYAKTPRQCKAIKQSLSVVLNYADRIDLLKRNIVHKLKIAQYVPKETDCYDLEQYKTLLSLLKTANHYIYIPVLLIGTCGLRPSEALALTIKDINKNTINVNKTCIYEQNDDGTTKVSFKAPKTAKSKRRIEINKELYSEIMTFRKQNNLTAEYICCMPTNTIFNKYTLGRSLKLFVIKHNLPHISPYGLRHTFGQVQKSLGTDIYTISRLMGHADIQITANTYLHKDTTMENAAMNKFIDSIATPISSSKNCN